VEVDHPLDGTRGRRRRRKDPDLRLSLADPGQPREGDGPLEGRFQELSTASPIPQLQVATAARELPAPDLHARVPPLEPNRWGEHKRARLAQLGGLDARSTLTWSDILVPNGKWEGVSRIMGRTVECCQEADREPTVRWAQRAHSRIPLRAAALPPQPRSWRRAGGCRRGPRRSRRLSGQSLHDPVRLRDHSGRGRGPSSPRTQARAHRRRTQLYAEDGRGPRTPGCDGHRPRP
jgi:hypothetical protein